ncbi:MAG: hypothetical protein IT379_38485 [Deltaproteobacteria bacterium]|nr:hypothetical protein [Deltaproteobacteria bacterium]
MTARLLVWLSAWGCALAFTVTARAQCRRDELRIELPAEPADGEARAHVHVRRSGRDPFDGPPGGTCVIQGRTVVHVPDAAERSFVVRASATELAAIVVGRETLHVSMPPGSELAFVSSACTAWRIEGGGLDVVDHHGARAGEPGVLWFRGIPRIESRRTPYGGECGVDERGEMGPPELSCRAVAQRGYCAPTVLRIGRARHTFWLRSGERWTVRVERGRVRSERAEARSGGGGAGG